jgi:hypothetical protein
LNGSKKLRSLIDWLKKALSRYGRKTGATASLPPLIARQVGQPGSYPETFSEYGEWLKSSKVPWSSTGNVLNSDLDGEISSKP